MDREAAKAALADFLGDRTLRANQIEFVNLIVDHLTDRGVLLPAALYESPFTDVSPTGPDAIFAFDDVGKLIGALEAVTASAQAA
jgi:type I restriction enzyme R subunit